MQKNTKYVAAAIAAIVAVAGNAIAGDWIDNFISQQSSTAPGSYTGQKRGYITGGSFSARIPRNSDYLVSAQMPRIKAGCGGIDIMGGGLSFLNEEYLVQTFENVVSAAPAIAFDIAIKAISAQMSDSMKSLFATISKLNSLQLDSCQASKALVATIANPLLGENMPKEYANSAAEFMADSGVGQLWDSAKSIAAAAWNKISGNESQIASSTDSDVAKMKSVLAGATSGCPAALKNYLGGGSILGAIASAKGFDSDMTDLMRGFIGDVYVHNTGMNYTVIPIPPCEQNTDFNAFYDGTAQKRPGTVNGTAPQACEPMTGSKKNLRGYAATMLTSIANKMKNKGQIVDGSDEDTFLKMGGLGSLKFLRGAVTFGAEAQWINEAADVTAKGIAYSALTNLLYEMKNAYYTYLHVVKTQSSAKAGSEAHTCDIKLFEPQMNAMAQIFNDARQFEKNVGSSYMAAVEESGNLQSLLQSYERYQEVAYSELRTRIGGPAAKRATGKI